MKAGSPSSSVRRLLTLRDAAAILQVSVWSVREIIWRGDLPEVRIGRCIRIDPADLDDYIARCKRVFT